MGMIGGDFSVSFSRTEELDLSWKIDNFSKYSNQPGQMIESRVFSIPGDDQYEWRLRLYPNCCNNNNYEDYVSVSLQLLSKKNHVLFSDVNVRLKNKNTKWLTDFDDSLTITVFPETLNNLKLIGRTDHFSLQLENDVLVVQCRFEWEANRTSTCDESSTLENSDIQTHALSTSDELLSIGNLSIGNLSDVTLESNDGVEFSAHKCILEAHIPALAATFEGSTREIKVHILDLDAETIKSILDLIYTGKIEEKKVDIEKLFLVADRYAIDILKEFCTQEFCKKLNTANAANFLLLADRHKTDSLKVNVIAFILKNWDDIIKTKALDLLFTERSLFYEILKNIKK